MWTMVEKYSTIMMVILNKASPLRNLLVGILGLKGALILTCVPRRPLLKVIPKTFVVCSHLLHPANLSEYVVFEGRLFTIQTADTAAEDAALDDLLAELDADRPKGPPDKKPRIDGIRKSLPEKQTPRGSIASGSRRKTSHTIEPYPLPQPRQFHSSINPDYVKVRSQDSDTLKGSPIKPS